MHISNRVAYCKLAICVYDAETRGAELCKRWLFDAHEIRYNFTFYLYNKKCYGDFSIDT